MSDLFKTLIAETNNEYAAIVDDGIAAGDVDSYISTGSYALNALFSGSIYKGLPSNKVTALAGDPSTGKTFYAINIVKQFLADNANGFVFYFESESAISKQMMEKRGVDTKRIAIIPVGTIQEFRTQAVKILDKYMDKETKGAKPPMLFVLDSLGMLSTDKEVQDVADGKDTRDMTRAQLIRGAFRVLTLKLGKAKVPLIVVNHTYEVTGAYVPTKKMSGGGGIEYAASTVVFLSKKKDRDTKTNAVTGALITATMQKSRMTIENKKVETLLDYENGLDPYYGLIPIAEKYGIFKKVSTRYEMPSGEKVFESVIEKNPEKYFTKEILDQIDECCQKEFLYNSGNKENTETLEESEEYDEANI